MLCQIGASVRAPRTHPFLILGNRPYIKFWGGTTPGLLPGGCSQLLSYMSVYLLAFLTCLYHPPISSQKSTHHPPERSSHLSHQSLPLRFQGHRHRAGADHCQARRLRLDEDQVQRPSDLHDASRRAASASAASANGSKGPTEVQ